MSADEKFIAQKMGTCKHFNGLRHDCCLAGVRYQDLVPDGKEPSARASMPCMDKYNPSGTTCEKREPHTREEAEARWRALNGSGERTMKAIRAIADHIKATGKYADIIDCPNCGNRLGYGKARSNGHVHARCDTPGCVSFMQ